MQEKLENEITKKFHDKVKNTHHSKKNEYLTKLLGLRARTSQYSGILKLLNGHKVRKKAKVCVAFVCPHFLHFCLVRRLHYAIMTQQIQARKTREETSHLLLYE